MRKNTAFMFATKIAGIPCNIDVTHYTVVKPNYNTWDSDLDYYGYTEFEFVVYDRKGYRAAWLAKKLTDDDLERIENEYRKHAESEYACMGD